MAVPAKGEKCRLRMAKPPVREASLFRSPRAQWQMQPGLFGQGALSCVLVVAPSAFTPLGQMQPGRLGHGTPGAETSATASAVVEAVGASAAVAAVAASVASSGVAAVSGAMLAAASALGAQEPFALWAQQPLWADADTVMKQATRAIRIFFMGMGLEQVVPRP